MDCSRATPSRSAELRTPRALNTFLIEVIGAARIGSEPLSKDPKGDQQSLRLPSHVGDRQARRANDEKPCSQDSEVSANRSPLGGRASMKETKCHGMHPGGFTREQNPSSITKAMRWTPFHDKAASGRGCLWLCLYIWAQRYGLNHRVRFFRGVCLRPQSAHARTCFGCVAVASASGRRPTTSIVSSPLASA